MEYHLRKYSAPSPLVHRQKAKCLLRLNHDCHAIICRASLWSATATGSKEHTWPTNWWIILCAIWNTVWKMFFLGILSIQCKIRCNRPGDTRRSIGRFQRLKSYIFWLEFWNSTLSFMQSTFTKRQFEFAVFVSCVLSLYFILWSPLSVTKSIFFILPIDWMLEHFCH